MEEQVAIHLIYKQGLFTRIMCKLFPTFCLKMCALESLHLYNVIKNFVDKKNSHNYRWDKFFLLKLHALALKKDGTRG
jgi:hypothetical protein